MTHRVTIVTPRHNCDTPGNPSIDKWIIFFQRLQTSLTPAVQRVSVRQWRAGQPLAHRLQRGHHAPLLQVPHRLLPPLGTLRRRVLDLIHYSTSGMHKLN